MNAEPLEGHMTWYSQAGQDAWVVEQLADIPHGGFFVDVGAHDGIVHSNTYALEQSGWLGICLEPNVAVYGSLASARTATCICAAASDRAGDLRMTGDVIDGHGPTIVKAVRLDHVLAAHFGETMRAIDYLSIDVEGHELAVLDGMDFDRWPVRLITVEHNLYLVGPAHKEAIHRKLTACGFERVVEDVVAPGYGPYEDWYAQPQ